jgi:multidrug resistance efflux pump
MSSRARIFVLIVVASIVVAYFAVSARPKSLLLTGIVTTDPLVVSPLVAGLLDRVTVKEGDVVTRNELLAVLAPGELAADRAYYAHSAEGMAGQIQEGQAALRYQEMQTQQQIRQAEANLAAVMAQQAEANANLENARTTLRRQKTLTEQGSGIAQELDSATTAVSVAQARVDAMAKQVDASKAQLALARSNAEQVTVRRSALASTKQQEAAAAAQTQKADVRLGYAEVHSPIDGVVDIRAARAGEVVAVGQPIVTLINPDDLWVRVDVEESYLDRVRVGDKLNVRLPWGAEREGTVFYRGVDAGFATQRDATREKRDIKTFEVRLRVDNTDRKLAVGLTAYVLLPTS